jgi:hypothetical protein
MSDEAVDKVVRMITMLTPDVRRTVLERMSPESRAQVERHMGINVPAPGELDSDAAPQAPATPRSFTTVEKRRMMREFAHKVHQERVERAEAQARELNAGREDVNRVPATPLERLRTVHPAALARAMQGERAETWALVLDAIDAHSAAALRAYLDGAARLAIEEARTRQASLPTHILGTIERAIASTIVPAALREQELLATGVPHGASHHG